MRLSTAKTLSVIGGSGTVLGEARIQILFLNLNLIIDVDLFDLNGKRAIPVL